MSRRSYFVAGGILGVVALAVVGLGLLLTRYEPRHYVEAPQPVGERVEECSRKFIMTCATLVSDVSNAEREWSAAFTDEELNSYLNSGFIQQGLSERFLPDGISEPRVLFEPDRVRLAFRYRNTLISTVISMDVKLWLAEGEPNVVAVQLEAFRAGVLPISAQWLLERLSEGCRQNGIDVNWYRHEGNPVALLRFQADQTRPTLQLLGLKIDKGHISIQGKSNEDAPLRTQLQLPDGLPVAVTN